MSKTSSLNRPRELSSDAGESKPLLSSDSKQDSSGRSSYDSSVPESAGAIYFLKGKNPTSISIVADSELVPPVTAADHHKQSSLVTIFVLWNTMVGTSLLSLPWGIERAGLGMGILLVVVMAGLCCYTAHCNVSAQSAFGPAGGEISELAQHLLGRKAELLSKLFSYIVLLGALIVYWILMTNFLYFVVDYVYNAVFVGFDSNYNDTEICLNGMQINTTIFSDETLFQKIWNLKFTVPFYLILVVGPLLSFKSVTFFTKFNSLGIMSLLYLLLFVMWKGWNWGVHVNMMDPSSVEYSEWYKPSFFATSGMLAMSYFLQNIVITVMRSNRNQKNNARDLAAAYFLAMGTYLIIGTVFYITFPLAKSCIGDNLLNNFASRDRATLIARVFLFFQLVTVFPLVSFMLRYQFMTAFFSSGYPSRLHILAFNAVIVVICVFFAVFLPQIGTIIRFTGALSGCFHIFTLPCLLRLASQRQGGQLTLPSLLLHLAIPLAGGINLLAQFFVSDR